MSEHIIVNRRTVARGLAWTVPAVAIATASPAFALSRPAPVVTYANNACKWAGNSCGKTYGDLNKSYAFIFDVQNLSSETVYFCDLQLTVTSGNDVGTWTTVTPSSGCYEVAANSSRQVAFTFLNSTNSGDLSFTGEVSMNWGHTCPCSSDPSPHGSITRTISVTGTPPGSPCDCPPPF